MRRKNDYPDHPTFFNMEDLPCREEVLKFKRLGEQPIWTEKKAEMIMRYLRYFVFITKHGTYIDAFAGPQRTECPDTWSARRVLSSEPRWLRNFHLFEQCPEKVQMLQSLRDEALSEYPKRDIQIYPGDANANLPDFLEHHPIRDKEATFCLLDRRTFECDWRTVQTLADHKKRGNKIELFYFLAQGWLDRAFSGLKLDPEGDMRRWWGNSNWAVLQKLPKYERGKFLAERFREELGYAYAYPFPILERGANGGRTMFWMVHASDHIEAPKLMTRAYIKTGAGMPVEPAEQLRLELNTEE